MSSIDFTARITKIERDLKKASIILKADTTLHMDRFAAFDDVSLRPVVAHNLSRVAEAGSSK